MKDLALYVHLPYCLSKCPYCDFNSFPSQGIPDQYVDSLAKEIRMRGKQTTCDFLLRSIYFGGGTPSLLTTEQLQTIMEAINNSFTGHQPKLEVTLEMNPGSANALEIAELKNTGINRLSIGVQSFSDENLRMLGRIHDAEDCSSLLDAVRTSLDNFGIDLIYAVPGQSFNDWERDLLQAVSFNPTHISCYCLTLEKKVPMRKEMLNKNLVQPEDEKQMELFLQARRSLGRNGYEHYEVSNFCRPGFESVHNTTYWKRSRYLGFGAGAHSFDPSSEKRSWNLKDPELYIRRISEGILPIEGFESLDRKEARLEALMLGLRTSRGISIKESFDSSGIPSIESLAHKYQDLGLVHTSDDRISLTAKGLFLSQSITEDMSRFI